MTKTFRIYTCVTNNGDGSSSVQKFGTPEQLDEYVAAYNEDSCDYQISSDDEGYEDLIFDENGILQNPDVYEKY